MLWGKVKENTVKRKSRIKKKKGFTGESKFKKRSKGKSAT